MIAVKRKEQWIQMTESKKVINSSDLTKLGLHSIYSQSFFSYERMQAPGFVAAMLPALKKIHGDDKEELAKAMTNNMDFINTEMHMLAFIQGLIISLEESGEDRTLIKNLKTGLFGPLAGLGDALFWFTLLPISAAIAISFNKQGSILGPIIFMAIWFLAAISRIWFAKAGYNLGLRSLDVLSENGQSITKIAGIIGVMVVGGLIPNYVSLEFPEKLKIFNTVAVQSVFDSIMPNLLPLVFVLFLYYLFTRKQVSITKATIGVIVLSVVLSVLKIL